MIKKQLLTLMSIFSLLTSQSQQVIPVYPEGIPNSKPNNIIEKSTSERPDFMMIEKITVPTLTIFLPDPKVANGTAVLICPGGGYWVNAFIHEGTAVAKKFNELGIAAFVLKYRIPDDQAMVDPSIAPLQDAQKSMLIIRSQATTWNIDTSRIGIMGFSAGGHLASTEGTHFQKTLIPNPKNISLRPDFMILAYPVISSDTNIAHRGSFDKLLGKNPSAAQRKLYSNELQVTSNTPPTFLIHATDDDVVPVANSIVFYDALVKNKVPAEIHIYEKGGHGFGMKNPTTTDQWMERLINWMNSHKLLEKK